MQRLAGAVNAVERDGLQIVVVDGEGGIGKTKILEAGRHLHDGRYASTRGSRPPAGPYQELFPLLAMLGAEEGGTAVLEEVSTPAGAGAVDLEEVLAKQGAAFARLSRRLIDAIVEECLGSYELKSIPGPTLIFSAAPHGPGGHDDSASVNEGRGLSRGL